MRSANASLGVVSSPWMSVDVLSAGRLSMKPVQARVSGSDSATPRPPVRSYQPTVG